MYAAARQITGPGYEAFNLVQLVSFGCGVDAVTTDEVRSILEQNGKSSCRSTQLGKYK
jgi:predicted nucleotide-binding protein (sugar kinase/HSP70/actin superfamily)